MLHHPQAALTGAQLRGAWRTGRSLGASCPQGSARQGARAKQAWGGGQRLSHSSTALASQNTRWRRSERWWLVRKILLPQAKVWASYCIMVLFQGGGSCGCISTELWRRRRRCWFTASEQKSPMEQKLSMAEGPFPAQRSPYLPDLQTIPELCSWDLSGGRSAGVLWDSAQLARLRSGYSQGSQEVLLLLIYTRQLSCLANTDKVIWGGKAKPARCLLGME